METSDDEAIWPNRRRSIFDEGPPRFAVAVGWLAASPKAFGYSEGYRRAADAIFERLQKDMSSREMWLLPLAYTWRHHAELRLKELLPLASSLLSARGQDHERQPLERGHSILFFWEQLRPMLERIAGKDAVELEHVESALVELNEIDPDGESFRYATRLKTPTVSSLKGAPGTVNLYALHETMTAVSNYLDAVRTGIQADVDDLLTAPDKI